MSESRSAEPLPFLLSESRDGAPWRPEKSHEDDPELGAFWLTNEAGDSLLIEVADVAALLNAAIEAEAAAQASAAPLPTPRFDHDGTYRHHHNFVTAEPVWWQNVEQFGGEKQYHRHHHNASAAPPDEGLLPAPPFPEEGCDCSACRVLRRHQAEMYAQRRALAADTDKP